MSLRRQPLDALQRCLCPEIHRLLSGNVVLGLDHRARVLRTFMTRSKHGIVRRGIKVHTGEGTNSSERQSSALNTGIGKAKASAPRITNISAFDYVAKLGSARRFPDVFHQAQRLVASGELKVTRELYEVLISACASGPLDLMENLGFALLAEMKEYGMKPTATTYNNLLRLLSKSPNYLRRSQILAEVHENWYNLSDEADQWVIMGYICDGQLEMAFDKIQRRSDLGLEVHMDVYKLLARCLIAFGEVDAALGVLNTVARKSPQGWQKLPWEQSESPDVNQWKKLWYDVLRVSAEERNLVCTRDAWMQVIGAAGTVPLFTPDEGIRLLVLYTAAQHGDVHLADSVLRALELEGLPRKEHHYAALIEAYGRSGEFGSVFSTLSEMRKNGVPPSSSTISAAIVECGSSKDSVSSALSELKKQHDSGVEAVDIESFHLILSALIRIGDLEGALNLYKNRPEIFPNFCMTPTADTFNILLGGCSITGQTDVASFITAEMKTIGIDPDETTYEALVKTCLTAPHITGEQQPYQLALLYLEEAGLQGFTLAQNVYMEIAMKCAEQDDVQSSMEVFEEMESRGWNASDARQKLYRKWREAKPIL